MAGEIGQGAFDKSGTLQNYTLVSAGGPASRDGVITAFRLWFRATVSATMHISLFTAIGNDLTMVANSRRELAVAIQGAGVYEWTAPSDFTEIVVSTGQYLGAHTPTEVHSDYQNGGGAGMWYKSGDYSEASGVTFGFNSSWMDAFEGDITEGASGPVIAVMAHLNRMRRS